MEVKRTIALLASVLLSGCYNDPNPEWYNGCWVRVSQDRRTRDYLVSGAVTLTSDGATFWGHQDVVGGSPDRPRVTFVVHGGVISYSGACVVAKEDQ